MFGDIDENGLLADKVSSISFFSVAVENTLFNDIFMNIKSDITLSCV